MMTVDMIITQGCTAGKYSLENCLH